MGIDQFAVQINLTLATGFLWFLFKKKHPVSFCKSLVLFLLLLLITQLVYTLAKTILPNPFAPGVHYVMVQNDGHELVVISPTEFFIIYQCWFPQSTHSHAWIFISLPIATPDTSNTLLCPLEST